MGPHQRLESIIESNLESIIFVYKSVLGDIRLWVGPRIEHLLSSWELAFGFDIHVFDIKFIPNTAFTRN